MHCPKPYKYNTIISLLIYIISRAMKLNLWFPMEGTPLDSWSAPIALMVF